MSDRREPATIGRPVDHSGDDRILTVALEALAEQPYDQVTIDAIAARAGRAKTTLYRRWPTKAALVLAAIRLAGRLPEAERLPDRGSLRADLIALVDSPWLGGADRRLAIFSGLVAAAKHSPELAEAVRIEITERYVEVYAALLQRALDRGELPVGTGPRIALLAQVIPAMSSHRLNGADAPGGRDWSVAVVDDVMLPALAGGADRRP